ncbi:GLPGLI family protein [Flavobacteriaceae bacterium Ap0902]|nr:GLPGLI family protein [Flavobacteriaceae bacterium Ap0902]
MKYYFFIAVSVFSSLVFSQNKEEIKVYSYDFIINGNYTATDLKVKGEEALFSIYYSKVNEDSNSEISDNETQSSMTIRIPSPDAYVYTNLQEGSLYSNEQFLNKTFIVKDSIAIVNWVLTDDFKEVLGHKCQKATASFRGRDYIAYFNPNIPESFGPWKFHGLPGLVFEISSLDDYLVISLRDISVTDQKIEFNVFRDEKPIDYLEYKKKVQDKYKHMAEYNESKNLENATKGFFMYDSIEHDLFQEVNDITKKKIEELYTP